MNTIKNIHKIVDLLDQDDLNKLESGAALHKRHSNIEFKIISVDEKFTVLGKLNEIIVSAVQGKSLSENYADSKTLIDRTKELFKPFFPKYAINVQPATYNEAIVEVVTPEWIKEQQLKKGVRIKDIIIDTGIDKTNLSAWINGVRPMSQPVKAMFYFYFLRK